MNCFNYQLLAQNVTVHTCSVYCDMIGVSISTTTAAMHYGTVMVALFKNLVSIESAKCSISIYTGYIYYIYRYL